MRIRLFGRRLLLSEMGGAEIRVIHTDSARHLHFAQRLLITATGLSAELGLG